MRRTEELKAYFAHLLVKKRLSHAYLLSGNLDSDKLAFAKWIAQGIFCTNSRDGAPCGLCAHCKGIAQDDFLDVHVILPEGATLKVDQIRQIKGDVAFSSMANPKKVFILDQVESMSVSAANSLLKVLEEPSGELYFLLLTRDKAAVLPTIVSRSQVIYCQQQSKEAYRDALLGKGLDASGAYLLSRLVQSQAEAESLLGDSDFLTFVDQMLNWAPLCLKRDEMALVQVSSRLSAYLMNKQWAKLGLEMLVVLSYEALNQEGAGERLLKEKIKLSPIVFSLILEAKKMLEANVTGVNAYEWLALSIKKGGSHG